MPSLNWDIFTSLPGSAEKNFELLCRGIVRQNFGGSGTFRALANQPGVEFHIKLDERRDALGDAGRWWGWQCKWFELAPNGALGSTRRTNIEEGIRKTEKYLPGITDWVLWTRRTLTKDDQEWFNGLSSKMKLHLWTADEVDNYLAGNAAVLRGTYFGEFVLTPDVLREQHDKAVAQVRARWQRDVHHVGDAERELCQMLGEVDAWRLLDDLAEELRATAAALVTAPTVPTPFEPLVASVVVTASESADLLERVSGGIAAGDLDLLRDELTARPRALPTITTTAPRKLRAGRQTAGLYATNAVAGCRDMVQLLADVEAKFSSRLVAVLAPAGCGKTQLAAQLTAGTPKRPPGVLLHGRDLHAAHTLDNLVRRVSIAAQPMTSMEALLAAVDAAGQRAQKRLPIFIDGLNESEDPRAWKPLLAEVESSLAKYPYVLLVCTLRPEFVDDALPDGTRRVKIEDYGDTTIDAVREHFRYWKIDATDVELPSFLSHPLTLRLFCEVTNPHRTQFVGIGAMPDSLTSLFERYLEQVGARVADLAPRTHRFYSHDVSTALTTIANKLWSSQTRAVEFDELRNILGDASRPWDQSIVRALEHEGVLLRMPAQGGAAFAPVYDLLGGHIIGKALLAMHGESSFATWLNAPATMTSLAGEHDERHPLADDILAALVQQVPRRSFSKQVWQLVDEPLRGRSLRMAAHLERASLDAATVDALLDLARTGEEKILHRLWRVRGVDRHPLNAQGLDQALRSLNVAERDLRWTEWLRLNHDELIRGARSVLRDIEGQEERWRTGCNISGDRLRARGVMWTLTSTIRALRDKATRALYWFGRCDPEGLFTLTVDSLSINDAYVSERMLAASYGVVMSHQHADASLATLLPQFLGELAAALMGPTATAPTHHYLARHYVRRLIAFTAKFYPASLPGDLETPALFAQARPAEPIADDDSRADEVRRTLQMDFKNYTLGRLFKDRTNYDWTHEGHVAAVAYLRGAVWELGWRSSTFSEIDERIAEDSYWRERSNRAAVERYGKKYGWIGFYNYAGMLEDTGTLRTDGEFSDVDIDPSFPEKARVDRSSNSIDTTWLAPSVDGHAMWMRNATTSLPSSVLRREAITGIPGPWVAVHGHLSAEDRVLGRYVWAGVSAMIVVRRDEARLMSGLRDGAQPWFTHTVPSDYYTYAGEIPWHSKFAKQTNADDGYDEKVRAGAKNIHVEGLAHSFAWESYHSKMNHAGGASVPSKAFSEHFDLRGVAQSFDQSLPDGTPASITLSGVDGLEADIVYLREDLLAQYVGDRAIVWLAFGERELRPFPPSSPAWLEKAIQERANTWRTVLTEKDVGFDRGEQSISVAATKASTAPAVRPERKKASKSTTARKPRKGGKPSSK